MRNRLKNLQTKMDKNWSKKNDFSGKSKKQDSTGKDQKKIRLRRSSLVHLQERRLCSGAKGRNKTTGYYKASNRTPPQTILRFQKKSRLQNKKNPKSKE